MLITGIGSSPCSYGTGSPWIFGASTNLCEMTGHSSAQQHPSHVLAYLEDEIHHGAIHGPYKSKSFGEIMHVSPFITRNKQDNHKRRVIVDLSWPLQASVNHYTESNDYMGTAFKL